jgi:hypothetical protein
MMAPQMRSPAPRANEGIRAEVIRNDASLNTAHAEPEGDFVALFVARRYGFALPLARAIVALARIGGAFA